MKIGLVGTSGDVGQGAFAPLSEQINASPKMGRGKRVTWHINSVLERMKRNVCESPFVLTNRVLDRDLDAASGNSVLARVVQGAATEIPPGVRINVVNRGFLDVSERHYGALLAGHERVGRAFGKCVGGATKGQVVIVE
ncbi:hypothetical protein [uncultured Tateyamaria sp.]|uniref:hypothetical protein n=1 Tax=uncultured Tateyamaria sp. TaxID=455651 RepID=UPI002633E3DB|nr:hypothetical protein [uncultured Tateyamaria sp.]